MHPTRKIARVTGVPMISTFITSIPGGLWEAFIGVWLIVKGFSPPVVAGMQSPEATGRAPIAALGQAAVAP